MSARVTIPTADHGIFAFNGKAQTDDPMCLFTALFLKKSMSVFAVAAHDESFAAANFLKGVRFSPDGTCALTCADDNLLRVYETPYAACRPYYGDRVVSSGMAAAPWRPVLTAREGETVYDYAWHPKMQSASGESCVFVSTSRDHPVHMWDAFTGQLTASYRAYSDMDELSAALSLAFNPAGTHLYCGFDSIIRVFDVSVPGRDCEVRRLTRTGRVRRFNRASEEQHGLIACLAFNPDESGVYAAGSYNGT